MRSAEHPEGPHPGVTASAPASASEPGSPTSLRSPLSGAALSIRPPSAARLQCEYFGIVPARSLCVVPSLSHPDTGTVHGFRSALLASEAGEPLAGCEVSGGCSASLALLRH